jgi:hypothetical protein
MRAGTVSTTIMGMLMDACCYSILMDVCITSLLLGPRL